MIESDLILRNWKPDSPKLAPGRHAVKCERARGLYVRLSPSGSITWLFRYKLSGKARQMAIGPYPAISLSAARDTAREAYAIVKAGRDPVDVKSKAETKRVTFADYAEEYLKDRQDTFKTEKFARQWASTVRRYAVPHIGRLDMNAIDESHIQKMLYPIWNEKRETAGRVLQRVGAIIGAAIDDGHRDRDRLNPCRADAHAAWKKRMSKTRTGHAGRRGHHPAVQVSQVADWFAALREKEGMGARVVEFVALTAVRHGEVRTAKWADVDFEKRVWTIPAENTKMSFDPNRQPHRVPLSNEAVQLLESIERREGVNLVFPSPRDKIFNDDTPGKVMRDLHNSNVRNGGLGWVDGIKGERAVPHGLRSTVRQWAAEVGKVQFEVAEAVLAHAVGGTVSLAYQRGNYFDERVKVMQQWADFLMGREVAPTDDDPVADAIAALRNAGMSADEIIAKLESK